MILKLEITLVIEVLMKNGSGFFETFKISVVQSHRRQAINPKHDSTDKMGSFQNTQIIVGVSKYATPPHQNGRNAIS